MMRHSSCTPYGQSRRFIRSRHAAFGTMSRYLDMHSESDWQFRGSHLFGEMYDISSEVLDDEEFLKQALVNAIPAGGATVCSVQSKKFEPVGVTVLTLLAESHASIHTYPERNALFLDIFTCGDCEPRKIFDHFASALAARRYSVKQIIRGVEGDLK